MMKLYLLLLAVELVISDKLDRSYLPPPGAKFSGGRSDDLQTPLEYPIEPYPITVQDGQPGTFQENAGIFGNEIVDENILQTTVRNDYLPLKYSNDFDQSTSLAANGYSSTLLTRPNAAYNSFLLRSPNQPNGISQSNPNFQTLFSDMEKHDNNQNTLSYYSYVPRLPIHGHDKISLTKTATSKYAKQDDLPTNFGYYGGKPMIMNFQKYNPKELQNKQIQKGQIYSYQNEEPLIRSDRLGVDAKEFTQLIKNPVVGTRNRYNSSDSENYSTKMPLIMNNTTNFQNKDNSPMFGQISKKPVDTRFRSNGPQADVDRNSVIINYDNVITPEGFSYAFDTSNGIHVDQSGTAYDGVKAKGSYSYTGDDGKVYTVTYIADENGFQPIGDHLPTPPPIPDTIKKVIEQAAKDRAAGIIHDGSYDENKYGHLNYQGADRYYSRKNPNISTIIQRPKDKTTRLTGAEKKIPKYTNRNNIVDINNKLPDNSNGQIIKNKQITESNTKPLYPLRNQNKLNDLFTTSVRNNYINNDIILQPNISKLRTDFNAIGVPQQTSIKDKLDQRTNSKDNEYNIKGEDMSENNNFNSKNKSERPNALVYGYKQNGKDISSVVKKPYETYISDIKNMESGYTNNVNKSSPKILTSYDNGYYYVPPLIEFQHNSYIEKKLPIAKNKSFILTDTPKQGDSSVERRTGLKDFLYTKTTSEVPIMVSEDINEDINDLFTTRKPYISGPKDQDVVYEYDDNQNGFETTAENDITTYTNDLDTSLYMSTTTPMSSQTQYGNYPTDGYYHQHYETTIRPKSFELNLPKALENRINIPSTASEISISQDVVTSTYKPGTDRNGINLEVNQNVKIYGVGKPLPTNINQVYPSKDLYGEQIYSTAIPRGESTFSGLYPEILLDRLPQNNNIMPGITNPGEIYDNAVYPSANPVTTFEPTSAGPYFNQYEQDLVTGIPDSSNRNLVQNNFIPGVVTFNKIENTMSIERVIGEDFSGPKQLQTFDPETGYHYK